MAEQISNLTAINNDLCDFSSRWSHDGDYMRCRGCKRPQMTNFMDMDFPHAASCRVAGVVDPHPWRRYLEIMERLAQAAQRPAAHKEST